MNEYIFALIYIALGLLGAVGHYEKKRWVDSTTVLSLRAYIASCPKSSVNAILAIGMAELTLSTMAADHVLTLSNVIGAVTAGYTFDSGLNKTDEK
jgi:hypothetical protein